MNYYVTWHTGTGMSQAALVLETFFFKYIYKIATFSDADRKYNMLSLQIQNIEKIWVLFLI